MSDQDVRASLLRQWEGEDEYKLWPYQEDACLQATTSGAVAHEGRIILGDEMGLGKTGIAYEIWKRLSFRAGCNPGSTVKGPALLITGENALFTWDRLAPNWRVPKPTQIKGSQAVREIQWKVYGGNEDQFVSCTREVFMRDMAAGLVPLQWQIVFTDEAHKHSNRKTKIAKALLSLKSPWFVICTGSPLKKGNTDLWFLLHLLDRRRWSSYWKYVTMWNHTEKGLYGGMEILAPKDVNAWQKAVSKYFIRRTKAQVRADMPPKIRQRDVVRPSATQQRLIRELAADNLSELQDALVVAPTVLARLTRMRQLLVSPRLLHPEAEWGAAIEALVAKLEDATDRHMAVFTPFAGAIPIVMDRLMAEGYPARSLVGLRGGLKGDDLGAAIQRFRETKGIAIVSIRFAESFDLTPANWGYFLGADWDPETNKQAEDRLHRGLIQDPVNILYAFHPHTTDEDVWAVLDSKTNITNASLQNLSTVRDAMMRILKAPENF